MEKEQSPLSKVKVSARAQEQLDRAEKKFEEYKDQINSLSDIDRSAVKQEEAEPQTKLSSREQSKLLHNAIALKPSKTIGTPQKFNEKFREEYEFLKERVYFIAEHKELVGDMIEKWTRPFGGLPAEFWIIPSNKIVYGPRYLAEELKKCYYIRYKTEDRPVSESGGMTFTGAMIAETRVQRLDAIPVNDRRSVFMGASNF